MAHFTLGEYQDMIADRTGGLRCTVTVEHAEDRNPAREMICAALKSVELLYIPPPRSAEELQGHIPPYLYHGDRRFWERHKVVGLLQQNTFLLRKILAEIPVFAEEVHTQQARARDGREGRGDTETSHDLAEEISRLRGLIAQVVFSLREHPFLQVARCCGEGAEAQR